MTTKPSQHGTETAKRLDSRIKETIRDGGGTGSLEKDIANLVRKEFGDVRVTKPFQMNPAEAIGSWAMSILVVPENEPISLGSMAC